MQIHKIIILPVVLYGFLTLKEEHKLRACEKRMMKRIFGPKTEEVIEIWEIFHNEKIHNLYSSTDTVIKVIKSRGMKWMDM
jgi:hypothetical protein